MKGRLSEKVATTVIPSTPAMIRAGNNRVRCKPSKKNIRAKVIKKPAMLLRNPPSKVRMKERAKIAARHGLEASKMPRNPNRGSI